MSVSEIVPNLGLKAVSPVSGLAARPPAPKESGDQAVQSAAPADSHAKDEKDTSEDSGKLLEKALNERISRLLLTDVRIQIDKDRDTGHFVYKSINSKTGELHRQFPAEQLLKLLAFFKELDGLLYDEEA